MNALPHPHPRITAGRARLRFPLLTGIAAALLVFTARGVATRSGSDARLSSGATAVTVEMTNELTYEPKSVTIEVGKTVEWINSSDLVHTVTADPRKARDPNRVQLPEGAEPFDSGDIEPGDSFTRSFEVPGTYHYVCLPHEAAGMLGNVVVERRQ